MPNTSYRAKNGTIKSRYVNPFSMLCDRCENRTPSDWIDERCRYECENCQRDWESEHEQDEAQDAFNQAAE